MPARHINPTPTLLMERAADWFRRQQFTSDAPPAFVARFAYLAGYRCAIRRNRQIVRERIGP
jgi:hypothetical protein